MSLMEVNEALTIIQEAAHEDANIIFGAVVDPDLHGRVKITVIATGFDHPLTAAAPTQTQTPVDMGAYAQYAARPAAPAPALAEPPAPPSRFTITRRHGLEMPTARLPRAVNQSSPQLGEEDAENPLEIPAFLRRSDG